MFPNSKLSIYKNNHIHSKWALADNNFVYTGSQNVTDSDSFENIVIFQDPIIYEYYKKAFIDIIHNKEPYNIQPKNSISIKKNYFKSKYSPYSDKSGCLISNVKVKFAANGMLNRN